MITKFIIDRKVREIMHLVAFVRVCLSVCLSRLNVWRVVVDTRGSACQVQQKAITIKFGVKGGYYRSEDFVCLSVIWGVCADSLVDAVDQL